MLRLHALGSLLAPSAFVSSLQGLGNLGLQNFHQRTLSAASSSTAKITCFAAAFIVPTLGIPPILLGAAAASTSKVQEQKSDFTAGNGRQNKLKSILFDLPRLELDFLWFSVPICARGDRTHPAHRLAAPHPDLHLHHRDRGGGSGRDVVHRLGFAVRGLHLHLQHLQEHPESAGEGEKAP